MLVNVVDADAPFQTFEIDVQAGSRRLGLEWSPDWDRALLYDITDEWQDLGETEYSSFDFGPALEARVDLRDLGSPDSVHLLEIEVRVGECCGPTWRTADSWRPFAITPAVDEVDPE